LRSGKHAVIAALALASSIGILNNFESGVVATIAATMVLAVGGPTRLQFRQPLLFLGLAALFLPIVLLVIAASYGMPNVETITMFVAGFGAGFGAMPMPSFGLWVLVFVFLSLAAIMSALHFRMVHYRVVAAIDDKHRQLATLALFWSAFGLGMSPYYINRSVVAGQLQFLLVPAFLSAAALFALLLAGFRSRRDLAIFIAAFPCALSMASTIDHPSLALAIKRLRHDKPSLMQNYEVPIAALKERSARIRARHPDAAIALFSNFGFFPSHVLNLRSYLPLNALWDLAVVKPSVGDQICAALAADGIQFLLADAAMEAHAQVLIGKCGYVMTDEYGPELPVLVRR